MRKPVPKFVIDTNLYVRAWRNPEDRTSLKAFIAVTGPHIHLHSVVAGELLAGCVTPEIRKQNQDLFITPFERRGRVITPSHSAWKRAGAIMAALVPSGRIGSKSFFNDCLLAASAREEGVTIITDNRRDFELIHSVDPVRFVAPWPIN